MFGGKNEKQITVFLNDAGGDGTNNQILLFTENAITIQRIVAQQVGTGDIALTTTQIRLDFYDGGTDGTGTGAIANRGGTTGGWTSGKVYGLTIDDDSIAAGRYLTMQYAEGGTIAFRQFVINVSYLENAGS